jgi:hypothetical protein
VTIGATTNDGSFIDFHAWWSSTEWHVARNLLYFFAAVFYAATVYWVWKDARRRVGDPWIVGAATLLGALPFLGPLVYLILRPPEYLEDVRERELEIRAMEERLALRELQCPVCRADVQPEYLVCPVCTTRLKQPCASCGKPLDGLWQVCPHCETPVERIEPTGIQVPRRAGRRRE